MGRRGMEVSMARREIRVLACVAVLGLLSGCGLVGGGDRNGRVTLEFFQFKPEAIQTFDKLIAGFERDNPNIHIQQNPVPDAGTAIRTRMVRDSVPDVMTLNADATFGELARAGVFYDFSKEPVVPQI
jgi:raffinose/stachyose/melibiose transport system substrate-binding protein